MKTPTHLAINYLIFSRIGIQKKYQKMFLLGGILPDLPLCIFFILACLYSGNFSQGLALFRNYYDQNLYVIAAHNVLHSPVSLAMISTLCFFVGRHRQSLKMFVAGCFSHSLVDIYTHVDDGPKVFWPLEQKAQFASVVSHWDARYGGEWVMLAELVIVVLAACLRLYRHHSNRALVFI